MTTDHQGAEDQCRAEFEAHISGPPFERDTSRFPNDERRYAWPGNYRDINVDLAWQAWQTAWNRRPASALRAAAQAVVDRWDSPQWKDQPHTAEFINRLRRALEAPAGGDGLPELPQHIAHLHYNGDMCWDTNHQIDVWPVDVYTADQMRQYARDALAAAKDRQALNDKQIIRGWLDWTEPGCSATDAFVAGVRFTEKHHGVAPPSDSAAEGGGENAGSKEQ